MFFLYFLITLFAISIEIHIENLKISTNDNLRNYLTKNSTVLIELNLFNLNIIKIDLTKLGNSQEKLENFQKRLKKKKNKLSLKLLSVLKYTEIKKFILKVHIGVKDAAISAILVGLLSTIISIFLRKTFEEAKENFWEIIPIYQNKNIAEIEFDGIFKVKVLHICNSLLAQVKNSSKIRYN